MIGAGSRFWEHLGRLSRRHIRHGKGSRPTGELIDRSPISKCGVGAACGCRPGTVWDLCSCLERGSELRN